MNVTATAGVSDHFSDVLAVLDDGAASCEIVQGDLVTDRNVMKRGKIESRIRLSDYAEHVRAGFEPFDDNDANVVLWAVNQEMGNFCHCPSSVSLCEINCTHIDLLYKT